MLELMCDVMCTWQFVRETGAELRVCVGVCVIGYIRVCSRVCVV